MNKKSIFFILGCVCICSLVIGYVIYREYIKTSDPVSTSQTETIPHHDIEAEKIENEGGENIENPEEIVRKKIENIKKRLSLKGLIIEGDGYFKQQQLPQALKKYLEFYRQNPHDSIINEKIGNTYYEMKKFSSAYNYYSRLSQPDDIRKTRMADMSFYTTDLFHGEQKEQLKGKIQDLGLSHEQQFFYSNSLMCIEDFELCKLQFRDYFWPQVEAQEETEDIQVEDFSLEFDKLRAIQEAIENYENFQVDDIYLLDAYIIGAWYTHKLYPLAISMGEKLLDQKPDYKPIIEIIAQSHFELGEYEYAREVLGRYYEDNSTSPDVSYMLGIINTQLREYVLGNIYLQKSIQQGYYNSIDARRQLIYNFFILDNTAAMLQAFSGLIEKEDYSQEDLQLAIYYSILHESYDRALGWSLIGQDRFEESANFHAYQSWILRAQGDIEDAHKVALKGQEREENNPFILLNIAYNEQELGNDSASLVLFKKIIQLFPESEFADQAQQEINAFSTSSEI